MLIELTHVLENFGDINYCEVIYLDRTEGISSTQLKNTLKTFSVSKDEIIKAFDILEQLKKDFE
jgi:glycerol-3-phosphate cytidylyltransferase